MKFDRKGWFGYFMINFLVIKIIDVFRIILGLLFILSVLYISSWFRYGNFMFVIIYQLDCIIMLFLLVGSFCL